MVPIKILNMLQFHGHSSKCRYFPLGHKNEFATIWCNEQKNDSNQNEQMQKTKDN